MKSRVAEERRAAGRATHQYEQVQAQVDKLLDRLNERARANDTLQGVLVARDGNRMCMNESYHGVVRQVHDDQVVVAYETDDDIIEQVYERSQFVDGRMPKEGDRIEVFVHVAQAPPHKRADHAHVDAEARKRDEEHRRRKRVITESYEF